MNNAFQWYPRALELRAPQRGTMKAFSRRTSASTMRLLVAAALAVGAAVAQTPTAVVQTSYGPVQGISQNGASYFRR
jgi:hypothetical protein